MERLKDEKMHVVFKERRKLVWWSCGLGGPTLSFPFVQILTLCVT